MKKFWKFLILSTLLINGLAALSLILYRHALSKRLKDGEWVIKQIVERGRGELPQGFFAEALELSQDKPLPWDLFDTTEAEQKLQKFTFLSDIKVRKVEPSTIVVDYVLRTPCALIRDRSNAAIDREGIVFPLHPFYTPKRLPSLYFGLLPVTVDDAKLAFSIMDCLSEIKQPPKLILIDLSEAHASSLGLRKITVVLQEPQIEGDRFIKPTFILQLSAEEALFSLNNWQKIRPLLLEKHKNLKAKGLLVDLRLLKTAYIKPLLN